jgi:alpha-galactosidase
MIKVAMIGAGSVVFSKNLTGDILSFPEFRNATLAYMDIDRDRLEVGAALCRKVAKALGASPRIQATLDRRQALEGADFVINMVQIGGFDSTLVDFEIPRKYGLSFTIADTTGPGGLFRALRTFPMLRGLCADMQEVCPRALLLNYSNPMSMNMQTVARTSAVRGVGLCHSVQGTFGQICRYIGQDPAAVTFVAGGINHMAFFLRFEKDGQDLYPRLFEAMNDPLVFASNKVRFELMKRLGYFVTESSEHSAEYCPWFIPRGQDVIDQFSVPLDEYLRRCDSIVDEFEQLKQSSRTDAPVEVHRSHEYGSGIIHSTVTGTPRVVYGNMPNGGAIANLPQNAIVEAPTLVDRAGPQLATVGELPPQIVGYVMPHVTQHELFIRAATQGRRDHVYQACMLDPLTGATLTTDQIVQLCDEMIAAHGFEGRGGFLPNLDAKKTLVPTSGRTFAPTQPHDLRIAWDAAQDKATAEYLTEFHVIGPFVSPTPGRVSLDTPTPVDADFARRADGSVDLRAVYPAAGQALRWQKTKGPIRRGFINFDEQIGRHEWAVGYAYTQIEETHGREAKLRCGSDDGIRIWVNGELVHEHEVGRGYTPNADVFKAYLRPGVNHIFIKLDNYRNGWGFGLAVPKARS